MELYEYKARIQNQETMKPLIAHLNISNIDQRSNQHIQLWVVEKS